MLHPPGGCDSRRAKALAQLALHTSNLRPLASRVKMDVSQFRSGYVPRRTDDPQGAWTITATGTANELAAAIRQLNDSSDRRVALPMYCHRAARQGPAGRPARTSFRLAARAPRNGRGTASVNPAMRPPRLSRPTRILRADLPSARLLPSSVRSADENPGQRAENATGLAGGYLRSELQPGRRRPQVMPLARPVDIYAFCFWQA